MRYTMGIQNYLFFPLLSRISVNTLKRGMRIVERRAASRISSLFTLESKMSHYRAITDPLKCSLVNNSPNPVYHTAEERELIYGL